MAGVVLPAGMGSLPTMDSLAAEAEGGDENAGAAAAADAAPQSSGILEAVAEGSLEKVEAVLKAMEEASSADGDATDFLEEVDERGNTALIKAAQLGLGAIVDKLLTNNASTSSQNNVGDTALHWACYRGDGSVVSALLRFGADFEVRGDVGNTPLHLAASSGSAKIVFDLVMSGASVTALNDYGNMPRSMSKR